MKLQEEMLNTKLLDDELNENRRILEDIRSAN